MASRSKLEEEILAEARSAIQRGVEAAEFSEMFFGMHGRLQQLCRRKEDRRRVAEGKLFGKLQDMFRQLQRKEAAEFEAESEALSGRLTVVVPKSLHAALKREAKGEGVSLSELIRLKLTCPFSSTIRSAFENERRKADAA